MKYVTALIISVFSVIIAYCTLDENIFAEKVMQQIQL